MEGMISNDLVMRPLETSTPVLMVTTLKPCTAAPSASQARPLTRVCLAAAWHCSLESANSGYFRATRVAQPPPSRVVLQCSQYGARNLVGVAHLILLITCDAWVLAAPVGLLAHL